MNISRTNVVDASRLAAKWEERGDGSDGDIRASYSADTIAFQSKVRKPFPWRGELWVAVSLQGSADVVQAEAVRLIPAEAFPGGVTTYGSRCGVARAARGARRDPMGFYHGVKVTRGGAAYVLSGPEERFVAGTPSMFEDDSGAMVTPLNLS